MVPAVPEENGVVVMSHKSKLAKYIDGTEHTINPDDVGMRWQRLQSALHQAARVRGFRASTTYMNGLVVVCTVQSTEVKRYHYVPLTPIPEDDDDDCKWDVPHAALWDRYFDSVPGSDAGVRMARELRELLT